MSSKFGLFLQKLTMVSKAAFSIFQAVVVHIIILYAAAISGIFWQLITDKSTWLGCPGT